MHVGDDGALRLEALDPAKRVVDTEMAGVAGIAKPVDDPEVEVFQRRPAFRRDIVEVGRVGGGPDTEAQRGNPAVVDQEGGKFYGAALPFGLVTLTRFDRMPRQDRRIVAALGRDEAIGE